MVSETHTPLISKDVVETQKIGLQNKYLVVLINKRHAIKSNQITPYFIIGQRDILER